MSIDNKIDEMNTLNQNENISNTEKSKNNSESGLEGENTLNPQEAIKELDAKAETLTSIPEYQIKEAEELGGSKEEINKLTADVDQKINEEKTAAETKIKSIEKPPLPPLPEKEMPNEALKSKQEAVYGKYKDEWTNLLDQKDMYDAAFGFINNPKEVKEVRDYKANIGAFENTLKDFLDKDFSYGKDAATGEMILQPRDGSLKSEEMMKIFHANETAKSNPEYKKMFERTANLSDRIKEGKLNDLFAQMRDKTNHYLNAASESERGEEYVKEKYQAVEKKISELEKKRDDELRAIAA